VDGPRARNTRTMEVEITLRVNRAPRRLVVDLRSADGELAETPR